MQAGIKSNTYFLSEPSENIAPLRCGILPCDQPNHQVSRNRDVVRSSARSVECGGDVSMRQFIRARLAKRQGEGCSASRFSERAYVAAQCLAEFCLLLLGEGSFENGRRAAGAGGAR